MLHAHSTVIRTYDPAGRMTSETQTIAGRGSHTFAYAHDADGLPSTRV